MDLPLSAREHCLPGVGLAETLMIAGSSRAGSKGAPGERGVQRIRGRRGLWEHPKVLNWGKGRLGNAVVQRAPGTGMHARLDPPLHVRRDVSVLVLRSEKGSRAIARGSIPVLVKASSETWGWR